MRIYGGGIVSYLTVKLFSAFRTFYGTFTEPKWDL